MIKKFLYLVSTVILWSYSGAAQRNDPGLGIIPAPKALIITSGDFVLNRESKIVYQTASDFKIARLFRDYIRNIYSIDIPIEKKIKAFKGTIYFSSVSYKRSNPEGYSLSVTPERITVSGEGAGMFYGLQTLVQLLPAQKRVGLRIKCAEIDDEPRYKYRGMHLDVARHFFPVSFIKKYIDLLAQYKLNTFHWHLTDDQGWRIEIKKYPKLTQVGAFRAQTLIGRGSEKELWFDSMPYGGFYTQDEIKDIVAYATARFVTVIPEIEMPGHSLAALASYPELACNDQPGPFKVAEKPGIFGDVYCAGKDNTFYFLEEVLTEVMALFPSKYIHIGGDECPKTRWKTCPYCQKRIKDNHLKDEHELQSYFIRRIEKFVNFQDRQIIGWDEILEGGLAPNATVMSWRGTEGGIAAAKQNHNVVMTPFEFLYFIYPESKTDQEPVSAKGLLSLDKVYGYNPTPSALTSEQQSKIIGVQGCVWTEYMKNPAIVTYMILPRIYALAEIAWTPLERKNYIDFSENRVPQHLARLDGAHTIYRVPTVIGIKDTLVGAGNEYKIMLKSPVQGAKMYYTLDGYTPGETSDLYDKPIHVVVPPTGQEVLKIIVITPSGKRSVVTTTILIPAKQLPDEKK